MKKILILIVIIFQFTALNAQLIEGVPSNENGDVYFSNVVKADSINSTELHKRAKLFFVDAFKSANDVIQLDDKESKTIVGKGFSSFIIPYSIKVLFSKSDVIAEYNMYYSLKVQSKDGRYKCEIYDIRFKYLNTTYGNFESSANDIFSQSKFDTYKSAQEVTLKLRDKMIEKVNALTDQLKEYMTVSKKAKSENW